jgi:hypothetical protein
MKRILLTGMFLAAAFGLVVQAVPALAEEPKYELKSAGATIKDVLQESLGKRVIVRLETGENLEGTVLKVGESVLHLAKLSGRDFYDAVVRIDRISAVIFKVRG